MALVSSPFTGRFPVAAIIGADDAGNQRMSHDVDFRETHDAKALYALYRLYLLRKQTPGPKILLVVLSGITVLLISITAEFGGKVAFGF